MLKNNRVLEFLIRGYEFLISSSQLLQPLLLLVFRLFWGWQLFLTGKGKLLQHANVVEFFSSLGIPFPDLNAWFVGGLECFGGLLLLVGLFSRPIALMMGINMAVAYLSVAEDREKLLNIFTNPDPFFYADPYFFLQMSIIILAFGPGIISIDALLKKYLFKR